MPINKVVFGNQTLIDISDTTSTAADVLSGTDFYTKDGTKTAGTLNGSYLDDDGAVVLNKGSGDFSNDLWYELPEETVFETYEDEVITGIKPFLTDVSFSIYTDYIGNEGYLSMVGTHAEAPTGTYGPYSSAGYVTVSVNDTRIVSTVQANNTRHRYALTHEAGSGVYTVYFSKTGTAHTIAFKSYNKVLKIGGYRAGRTNLCYKGTVHKYQLYSKCLTAEEVGILWDGGTLGDKIMILGQEYNDISTIKVPNQNGGYTTYTKTTEETE